jgi:hypothetical protein
MAHRDRPIRQRPRCNLRRGLTRRRDAVLMARKCTSRSLLQAYQQFPRSVTVPALEAVREALTARLCTLNFRLALLDASPRTGYYRLFHPAESEVC